MELEVLSGVHVLEGFKNSDKESGHPKGLGNQLACLTKGFLMKPFGDVFLFKKGDEYLL